MNLDELIPDDARIPVNVSASRGTLCCSGADFKHAIRAEIDERIRVAMRNGIEIDGHNYLVAGNYKGVAPLTPEQKLLITTDCPVCGGGKYANPRLCTTCGGTGKYQR